jgi:hypothetical protein
LFNDVIKAQITKTTRPQQIQQSLLTFLKNRSNSGHQSFHLALRIFSYASSVKTLFKLVAAKSTTKTKVFQLDDSGRYYGIRDISDDGIVLQVVQQSVKCENPNKYSFLEISENETATAGMMSSKFWLLDLSSKGNLPNFLRRFITNNGLHKTMIVYDSRGNTMVEFMMSYPIPVVHHCYILGETGSWQSYSTLGIDYFPQSRFCTFAISGSKIVSIYMVSPYIFLDKRNPFEGFFECGDKTRGIPKSFPKIHSGTGRELLPPDFDTLEQQGIHLWDVFWENSDNAAEINAFFTAAEEVFPPEAITVENFRTLLGEEGNKILDDAVEELFGYINNPATIQLFFGSEEREYTKEHMQAHLRRIVEILPAIIGNDDIVRENVIRSMTENIQLNGGCAQGYRNRLYAIIAASV